MRKHVLMYGQEPTDEELSELMKEVAAEAKAKAIKADEKYRNESIEALKKIFLELKNRA